MWEFKISNTKNTEHEKTREQQLYYALEWFKYHADQRYKTFQMYTFLVAAHIAAYGAVYSASNKMINFERSHDPVVYLIISISLAVFSFLFLLLDFRNKKLVHLAEGVLKHLETSWLFCEESENYKKLRKELKNYNLKGHYGILLRDAIENKIGGKRLRTKVEINNNLELETSIKKSNILERILERSHSGIVYFMYVFIIVVSFGLSIYFGISFFINNMTESYTKPLINNKTGEITAIIKRKIEKTKPSTKQKFLMYVPNINEPFYIDENELKTLTETFDIEKTAPKEKTDSQVIQKTNPEIKTASKTQSP